ncbi:MAG: formylglycine-generating enzyme family protein [Planctomycetota bacterium]
MMNKSQRLCIVGVTALFVMLAASVRLAAQDKAALIEKKRAAVKYVPVKLDAAAATKLQADWAAKLGSKNETKTALGIAMVLIPPAGEALPKPYWIGKYEVTQGEWKAVTGSNPASFRDGKNAAAKGLDTSRHPVETVTWFECLDFCNRLSEKEGLKPYYGINVIERNRENKQISKAEIEILGGDGYHLPTPTEWAHANRAGSVVQYFFGDRLADMDAYGWHDSNSDNRTHAAGEKKPNAFGLHDTYGNVREWVQDFDVDAKTKKIGRAKCYGGGFNYKPLSGDGERAHGPNDAISFIGLRVARDASPSNRSER